MSNTRFPLALLVYKRAPIVDNYNFKSVHFKFLCIYCLSFNIFQQRYTFSHKYLHLVILYCHTTQGQIQDFRGRSPNPKNGDFLAPSGPASGPNLVLQLCIMGSFPTRAQAKAPWPPPLEPPL